MRRRLSLVVGVAVVILVAAAGARASQDRLPKLPPAYAMPQAADSPGQVTFNHHTHVNPDAPGCTSCHPRLFKILKPGAAANGKPVTHATMEKGEACGACHNRKTTFGFDDCTLCHR